jgi:alkanesulfonate monooxygenase SsuD/methylene tetrahydromethanopterin reductase-like flavin-dependent oxidoreductase (luciferase family)
MREADQAIQMLRSAPRWDKGKNRAKGLNVVRIIQERLLNYTDSGRSNDSKGTAVRFGIRLIEHLGPSCELLRLAVAAEAAGLDSVWFPHDTFMRNTWVLTSAAATLTTRVQLGGVGINPYTNDPCEIATYAATLDELSGGRCILGLGMHTGEMVRWTGIDTSDCLQRTREAVDLIRRLLRGEIAANAGPSFHWSEQCYLRFKPLRA